MMRRILTLAVVLIPLTFLGQNFKNRAAIGEDSARQMIKSFLSDNTYKLSSDTLIKDKDMAVSIAELLLFKSYGKALITSERPYECYLVDGYWFLRGTLPKNYTGDVFEMIMSAKDGRIVKMNHGTR
jgi:NTF2 fold immunity protein of polymorphic toxin system component